VDNVAAAGAALMAAARIRAVADRRIVEKRMREYEHAEGKKTSLVAKICGYPAARRDVIHRRRS